MPEVQPRNIVEKFFNTVHNILEGPVVWVRGQLNVIIINVKSIEIFNKSTQAVHNNFHNFIEKIVVPNQQSYPWYHQKFRRVPTIDECYTDDVVCYFEANCQYKRDR